MILPNLFIIGAAKCGTTSLASWLALHPAVCMSSPKETEFFSDNKKYSQGIEYYSGFFKHFHGHRVIADASPQYSHRDASPEVAMRIYKHCPDARIIYMVRNPIEMITSLWHMLDRSGSDVTGNGILDLIGGMQHPNGNLSLCNFQYQLEPYLRLFTPGSVKVVFLDEFSLLFRETAEDILKFLGIEPMSELLSQFVIANSKDQSFVESKSLAEVRRHCLVKAGKRLLPGIARSWVVNTFFRRKLVSRNYHPSHSEKSAFYELIGPATERFLECHGKPPDLWRPQA